MNFTFAFHITCFIGFTLLRSALQKQITHEDNQSLENENDDLAREEQNYRNHYTDDLPGTAQLDYPIFTTIPRTGFSCKGKINWHYYADIETDCQVFHICENQYSKISFLCPEGSIFNQKHLVCDWWYNVDCMDAVDLYTLSNDLHGRDFSVVKDFQDEEGFDLNLASSGGNEGPRRVAETERKTIHDENKIRGRSKSNSKETE